MYFVQGDHGAPSPSGELRSPCRLDGVPESVSRSHRRADYRPSDQRSVCSRKPVTNLPASQGARTARYRVPVGICKLRAGRTKRVLTGRGSWPVTQTDPAGTLCPSLRSGRSGLSEGSGSLA